MRDIKYISPSSMDVFYSSPELYFLRYLAENRLPRDPQTKAMSVGSAFDAMVKGYLLKEVVGVADPTMEFFNSQVSPENKEWAWTAGYDCFMHYRDSGALADLMLEMSDASETPRFEFDLSGEIEGVTFFGKPDLAFTNASGIRIIYDWKVNGYCSSASPVKGYVKIRDAYGSASRPYKGNAPLEHNGMLLGNIPLADANVKWATQLAVYSLCLGGADVVGIDQLVWRKGNCRIASHRSLLTTDFLKSVVSRAKYMWKVIHSDWFFRDLTPVDSRNRCKALEYYTGGLSMGGGISYGW